MNGSAHLDLGLAFLFKERTNEISEKLRKNIERVSFDIQVRFGSKLHLAPFVFVWPISINPLPVLFSSTPRGIIHSIWLSSVEPHRVYICCRNDHICCLRMIFSGAFLYRTQGYVWTISAPLQTNYCVLVATPCKVVMVSLMALKLHVACDWWNM